jgi:hypothetical protein
MVHLMILCYESVCTMIKHIPGPEWSDNFNDEKHDHEVLFHVINSVLLTTNSDSIVDYAKRE